MQFVSFNIDLADVPVVRQALADSMATCVCAATETGKRCATCRIRAGLIEDLERVSQRASGESQCRSMPLPASLAFGADRREIALDTVSALPIGLRVMRGGMCDD